MLFGVSVPIPLGVNALTSAVAVGLALLLPCIASGLQHAALLDTPQVAWYRQFVDAHRNCLGVAGARIAAPSTYPGHVSPTDTYWHLTASPELLHPVNDRIQNHRHGGSAARLAAA